MKKMTLENSFHNTAVTIYVENDVETPKEAYEKLEHCALKNKNAKRKLKKIQKTLCGINDCVCGVIR